MVGKCRVSCCDDMYIQVSMLALHLHSNLSGIAILWGYLCFVSILIDWSTLLLFYVSVQHFMECVCVRDLCVDCGEAVCCLCPCVVSSLSVVAVHVMALNVVFHDIETPRHR